MKRIYKIEIEELLQRVVEIETENVNEAIRIAKEKYRKEEYVLDENDFKGVKFSEYKCNNTTLEYTSMLKINTYSYKIMIVSVYNGAHASQGKLSAFRHCIRLVVWAA